MSILFCCEDCGKYFTLGTSTGNILTFMSMGNQVSTMAVGGSLINQDLLDNEYFYFNGQVDSKICPFCYSANTIRRGDNEKTKLMFQKGKPDRFRYTLERIINLCKVLPFDYDGPTGKISGHISNDCKESLEALLEKSKGGFGLDDWLDNIQEFHRDLILYSETRHQVYFAGRKKGKDNKGYVYLSLLLLDEGIELSKDGVTFFKMEEVLADPKTWEKYLLSCYDSFHNYSLYVKLD